MNTQPESTVRETFDDSMIDALVWSIIATSRCTQDFRTYLDHRLAAAAHEDEALDQLAILDEAEDLSAPRYGEVVSAILSAAEKGDATAQFHAGKILDHGLGTERDTSSAEKWYRLAMLQGDLRATVNLALLLEGSGSEAQVDRAAELLESAAARGETLAMQNLARIHAAGPARLRDVAKAAEWLLRAWDAGDASAGAYLGEMFDRGVLPSTKGTGREWLEKAAAKGDARANALLGAHAERDGQAQAAAEHYRAAALAGDVDAARALGLLYLRGQGMPRDGAEAVKWLLPGALRGSARAQCHLGVAYLHGIGVLPNRKAARRWLERAAAGGDATGSHQLGLMLEREDPAAAAACFLASAKAGVPDAQVCLGLAYWRGAGLPEDPRAAYKWIRLAALQNDPDGLYLTGCALQAGVGVDADTKAAIDWFRKGAERGNLPAMTRLGRAYLAGQDVDRDVAEAAFWLTRAADSGSPDAEFAIGVMFLLGDGVATDAGQAASWFLAAAEHGLPRAQFELAKLYLAGQGVARNPEEGERWMRKAAEGGHDPASEWLLERQRDGLGHSTSSEAPTSLEDVDTLD